MIAKGVVTINQEELIKLFNLPKDTEIVAVKMEDGVRDTVFEFNIMTPKPVGRLTIENPTWSNIRKQRVPRARLTDLSATFDVEVCDCDKPSGRRHTVQNSRYIMCEDCEKAVAMFQPPVELRKK